MFVWWSTEFYLFILFSTVFRHKFSHNWLVFVVRYRVIVECTFVHCFISRVSSSDSRIFHCRVCVVHHHNTRHLLFISVSSAISVRMSKPRICSYEKCPNQNLADVITCGGCKVTFHQKCYGMNKQLSDKIIDNMNLMFLCDNCVTILHPSNTVNMCNNMYTVACELSTMKKVVDDIQNELKSQTSQMPPTSLFGEMISSLSEINTSLKSINAAQQISTTKTDEAYEALRNIQSALPVNSTPPVDWDEMKNLMCDVRSALQQNNNGQAHGGIAAFSFGQSGRPCPSEVFGRNAKRRRDEFDNVNRAGSPEGAKQPSTICTGPANTELITVGQKQSMDDPPAGYKSMVASRFAPSTDTSKILAYVKANLSLGDDSSLVMVRSLAPRDRQLTELTFISFKITVSDDLYDKIMDPAFWPANTLIREFEPRIKKAAAAFF